MSKKYKENLYRLYQLQVKDKDKAVQAFIENTLAKHRRCLFIQVYPIRYRL